MLIPAVIVLTCLSYSGCDAEVQKSNTVGVVYGDKFQVELKGSPLNKELELKSIDCTGTGNYNHKRQRMQCTASHTSSVDVTDQVAFDHLVRDVRINRRIQYIKGMELICGGNIRFWCTKSGSGKRSWNTTEVLMQNSWAVSNSKCNSVGGWCMKCDQSSCPPQTLDCTDPDKLDQNSRDDNHRCKFATILMNTKCKSIPVLMNPGCKEQGCIGHKEKTSIIQMYKQPKCVISDTYFKLR